MPIFHLMNGNANWPQLYSMDPEQLVAFVNQLAADDFPALVQLLYRFDVSEEKLRAVLAEHPGADAGRMIAALLVDRIAQAKQSRRQFRADNDIPEDEKW